MKALMICAAVEDELEALEGRLMRHERVAIGVGPVEAALGSFEALQGFANETRKLPQRAKAAVLLGTCGAFSGSGLAIGEAVVVDASVLSAVGVATGLAYIPALGARPSAGDEGLCEAIASAAGLRQVGSVTVPGITATAEGALALRESTRADVEHMEAHAFLLAAERLGVPAACVLGVANEVGPNAHEEWKAHGALAAQAAVDALLTWVRSVA